MAVRPTLELGNPLLRQPALPVADPANEETQALIADLRDTLQDWRSRHGWGRALSAPTIGVPLRVVLIEWDSHRYILINPRFERWGTTEREAWESCITFPSLWGSVTRPTSVVVVALDEGGIQRRWEADGDLARIMQHEIDHLDGFVWLDREPDPASLCTTDEYQRRYRQQSK